MCAMKFSLLSLVSLLIVSALNAQCPTAGFTLSGPGCAAQNVQFNNTSTGSGLSYEWDFCGGDLHAPTIVRFDTTASFATPTAITPVFDGTNCYAFVSSRDNSVIGRISYGNSFDNPIQSIDAISVPGSSPNGLKFIKEGTNWYAVVANVFSGNALLVDFGNSLSNNTVTSSVIPTASLGLPRSVDIVKDSVGNIFAAISNFSGNKLCILDFGTSILNTPTLNEVGVTSGNGLIDAVIVKDCSGYYCYGAAYYASSIVRFDFGSSLMNNSPVQSSVISLGTNVSCLTTAIDSGRVILMAGSDVSQDIKVVDAGSAYNNATATLIYNYSPAASGFMGIDCYKEGSQWYVFGTDPGTGKYFKANMSGSCNASVVNSGSSNPSGVFYNISGNYTVELKVTDANGNESYTAQAVSVLPTPQAFFSIEDKCFGDQTQLIDSSIISSGTISSYKWFFGDGDSSSVAAPLHNYTSIGVYTATLIAIANSGCSDTSQVTFGITPYPTASFTTTPGCAETPITFTDQSSISQGSITGWIWSFGNGDSLFTQNPQYLYPSGGNYLVALTAISDSGCSASTSNNVLIDFRPDADFTANNTCVGQNVQFINLTTSASSITGYAWDFGDSNSDTTANPAHNYGASVANYFVSLIAQAANGCIDTIVTEIKVNNIPSASFSISQTNICQNNNVQFNDLSSVAGDTISGWFWDFGDTYSDTVQNPVHQYALPGNYTVTLVAYSPSSCGNSTIQNITVIESPVADFAYSDVCFGLPSTFTDFSTVPSGSIITSYQWSFGDTNTSSFQNPVNTYDTTGSYVVSLTVTSNFGCTNTDSATIRVNTLPVSNFNITNPCSNVNTQFTDLSTIDTSASITQWQWSFGDPASGGLNSSTVANPVHVYADTMTHAVTLIVTTNTGCSDTNVRLLTVKPAAVANFQYSPTCYGDLMIFTNFSTGSPDTAWSWSFGDTQTSPLEEPAHYYAFPGVYNVTYTVTAVTGCVSTVTKQVTVSSIPNADFATQPFCIGNSYQMQDMSTIQSGSIHDWFWTINGTDTFSVQSPSYTFADTGTFNIKLEIVSDIGCTDSVKKTINVYPLPVPNFSFTPQYGNPPLNVTFDNVTTGANNYIWNFGDGSSSSTLFEPQHLYTDTGRYYIQLISTSQYGCVDSLSKLIYVIKPLLDLAVSNVNAVTNGNVVSITATVTNLGTRDVNNFVMEASVNGGIAIAESSNTVLVNGASGTVNYSFNAGIQLPESETLQSICVRATKPNGEDDSDPSNNEDCKSADGSLIAISPYPNPFNDAMTLQVILPFEDNLEVTIFNALGQSIEVYSGDGRAGLNEFVISGSTLEAGLYFVKVSFRDGEQTFVRSVSKVNGK